MSDLLQAVRLILVFVCIAGAFLLYANLLARDEPKTKGTLYIIALFAISLGIGFYLRTLSHSACIGTPPSLMPATLGYVRHIPHPHCGGEWADYIISNLFWGFVILLCGRLGYSKRHSYR